MTGSNMKAYVLKFIVLLLSWHVLFSTANNANNFFNQSKEIHDIPLPSGDTWPHGCMVLQRTKPDATLDESDIQCPGYKN
jgi:hypothetical protein